MRLASPNLRNAARKTDRQRRSTCKLCWLGLYEGQPAVWLTQPMGLSHQDCADRHAASSSRDHSLPESPG